MSAAGSGVQELCLSSDDDNEVAVCEVSATEKAVPAALASRPPAKAEAGEKLHRSSQSRRPLPQGWVRKQSKTKKGAYYYANFLTGKTQVDWPGGPLPPDSRGGPRSSRPGEDPAEKALRVEKAAQKRKEETLRRADEAAAREAELEEVKRKAAERRAAREKAVANSLAAEEEQEQDKAGSRSASGSSEEEEEEEAVTQAELQKWKEVEQQREEREAKAKRQRLVADGSEKLPPLPTLVQQACLDVLKDGAWVDRHELAPDKQRWTLGRGTDQVDFPMNHNSISRQHAALTRGAAGTFILDLNSSHGVQVNGQKIAKNVSVNLKNGARIKFGSSSRLYVYHEPGK